jgi:hypothetical protein
MFLLLAVGGWISLQSMARIRLLGGGLGDDKMRGYGIGYLKR